MVCLPHSRERDIVHNQQVAPWRYCPMRQSNACMCGGPPKRCHYSTYCTSHKKQKATHTYLDFCVRMSTRKKSHEEKEKTRTRHVGDREPDDKFNARDNKRKRRKKTTAPLFNKTRRLSVPPSLKNQSQCPNTCITRQKNVLIFKKVFMKKFPPVEIKVNVF